VASRITALDKIKLMKREDFDQYKKSSDDIYNLSDGFISTDSQEIVIPFKSFKSDVSVLVHELTHLLANTTILVRIDLDTSGAEVNQKTTGFERIKSNTFSGLNEALTQMITLDYLLWEQGINSKNIGDIKFAYLPLCLFFEQIIKAIAKKKNMGPIGDKELRFDLYKAYFYGDFKALEVFREIMSPQTFKKLAKLDSKNVNHVELMLLLEECGLDSSEYETKYESIKEGGQTSFFEYNLSL